MVTEEVLYTFKSLVPFSPRETIRILFLWLQMASSGIIIFNTLKLNIVRFVKTRQKFTHRSVVKNNYKVENLKGTLQ